MLIQIHINEKLIKASFVGLGQKWVLPVWPQHSKFDCILKMHRCSKLIFFNSGANSGKAKIASMIFGWAWSKMGMTFYFINSVIL